MDSAKNIIKGNRATALAIARVYGFLKPKRRRQLAALSMLMVVYSFFEAISIASIVPFLGVLTSPEKIADMQIFRPVLVFLEIHGANELRLAFTLLFVVIILISGTFRILYYWVQARLSMGIGIDLSVQVYKNILYQPYGELIKRNSSEILAGAHKARDLVGYIIQPTLTFISSVLLLAAVLLTLLLVEPVVAISAVLGFGSLYVLATLVSKRFLQVNSIIYAKEMGRVNKAIQEGIGGIRDVIIDGTQATLTNVYRHALSKMQHASAGNVLVAQLPRFVIEMLGLVFLAGISFTIVSRDASLIATIPALGAVALGAQRLLPVLQQAYVAYVTIRGGIDSINDALSLLDQAATPAEASGAADTLTFKNTLLLDKISFAYAPDLKPILNDITIEIKCGTRIGLIGTTGGGKSTLVDLIMGLLSPSNGSIYVDGVRLCERNIRSWHSFISHVPQSIYLADSSVAQNIAFGIEPQKIDMELMKQAAEMAQLTETISGLEKGYDTYVGERGIRLSGGQRQRIGIARALYKKPSILILDEATSALDSTTEKKVTEAIEQLDRKVTVITIAHRVESLKNCHVIYRLDHGALVWQGVYSQIEGYSAHHLFAK
jgi:ABC-type multidrug transport system fused ATPase/permease subunit